MLIVHQSSSKELRALAQWMRTIPELVDMGYPCFRKRLGVCPALPKSFSVGAPQRHFHTFASSWTGLLLLLLTLRPFNLCITFALYQVLAFRSLHKIKLVFASIDCFFEFGFLAAAHDWGTVLSTLMPSPLGFQLKLQTDLPIFTEINSTLKIHIIFSNLD